MSATPKFGPGIVPMSVIPARIGKSQRTVDRLLATPNCGLRTFMIGPYRCTSEAFLSEYLGSRAR